MLQPARNITDKPLLGLNQYLHGNIWRENVQMRAEEEIPDSYPSLEIISVIAVLQLLHPQ